ncbi:hypothetical protein [Nonomuraea turcica]|uniref:hypothetical protein n=1 Tax=Nonomuraea sp. G32 TaxID=3067274 RepID=UPI00273AB66A|nr:hypothetical protein [Nonomuraea sp. G32]MDP4505853.1 hypothetical protein [Nonomuraea sp. G32]
MDDNVPNGSTGNDKLPLRWALILTISTAVGISTGLVGGLVAGVGLGFVCAGFLHAVLPGDKR